MHPSIRPGCPARPAIRHKRGSALRYSHHRLDATAPSCHHNQPVANRFHPGFRSDPILEERCITSLFIQSIRLRQCRDNDIQYVGIDTLYVENDVGSHPRWVLWYPFCPVWIAIRSSSPKPRTCPSRKARRPSSFVVNPVFYPIQLYLQTRPAATAWSSGFYEYVSLSSQYQIQGETRAGDQDGSIELTSVVGGVPPYEGIWEATGSRPPSLITCLLTIHAGHPGCRRCLDTLFGLAVTPGATVAIDAGPDRTAGTGRGHRPLPRPPRACAGAMDRHRPLVMSRLLQTTSVP